MKGHALNAWDFPENIAGKDPDKTLTAELAQQWELGQLNSRKWHNTYYNPTTNQWQVRLNIGGTQVLLATFSGEHRGLNACRFADMAITYFWKYRRRSVTPEPTDADLNFGVWSAQKDLSFALPFKDVLVSWEKHFRDLGVREAGASEAEAVSVNKFSLIANGIRNQKQFGKVYKQIRYFTQRVRADEKYKSSWPAIRILEQTAEDLYKQLGSVYHNL